MTYSLNPNERIRAKARISIAALVVFWCSVPVFLLVGFCGTYLPAIIGTYAEKEAMEALLSGLGVETATFGDVFSAVGKELFGTVSAPLMGFAITMLVLLIVCWVVWGCVCTKLHFRCFLMITDSRVIGSSGKQTLDAPVSELVNVFAAQSWMGKLFRYGTVTVQTKRGSLTVKNVSNVQEIKMLLTDLCQ